MDNQDFQNVPPNLPVEPEPPVMPEPLMPSAPQSAPIMPKATMPPPPPPPPYNPAVPDFNGRADGRKFSVLSIVVLCVVIIIIIVLAFLLYYFTTKSYTVTAPIAQPPVSTVTNKPAPTQQPTVPATPATPPTNVITFSVPDVLPAAKKIGNCLQGSLAAAERQDAFRCTVGAVIYDPCFTTPQSNSVFCQMNPTGATSFLINFTKPLPTITLPATIPDNWAWFVKLKNGTICSPFTGTLPTIGGVTGVYGCRPPEKTLQIFLGSLTKGQTWTAQETIFTKQGTAWVQTSSAPVEIDTVWQ